MMKRAFTLLELVFVVVVIGILAAVILPSTTSNVAREAATKLVSNIRYTQHLAMIDDKYDSSNANWYRNRWQIVFNANKYSIVSENNSTFAIDPLTQANLNGIELEGVTVALTGGCNGATRISFDNMGRAMVGDLSDDTSAYIAGQLMTATCVITITDGTNTSVINVEPETGYAHVM